MNQCTIYSGAIWSSWRISFSAMGLTEYLDPFANRMLSSHIRAMQDIVNCRTEQMGGHLYCCENPDREHIVYAYHSCGNRSCPKCGQDKTQKWIEKQHNRLLPTHCSLVTLTLPSELRPIARLNQKVIYKLLFKSSAAPFQKLAQDPRFVGGDIGMMGGLHTWQRDMRYHLHVHFIVTSAPPFALRVDPNAARLAFHCDGFNGCGIAQAEFHIDDVRRFKAG